MGTIVSQMGEREEGNCPSAVLAAKAKIRQDLLKAHMKNINKDEKSQREDNPQELMPEWFPPGIHYSCQPDKEGKNAVIIPIDQQMDWMSNKNLTSRDLHRAMYNLSKKDTHHFMRLVQVTPLQISELNIRSDFHSRLVMSESTPPTVEFSEGSKSNLSEAKVRKTAATSGVKEDAIPISNPSCNGEHFGAKNDVVMHKLTDERVVSSLVIAQGKRFSSGNSMTDEIHNDGHIQMDIKDKLMQPKPLTNVQNNPEDDEDEVIESTGETQYGNEYDEDIDKGTANEETQSIQYKLDTGSMPVSTSDNNCPRVQEGENKQFITEGSVIHSQNTSGKISNAIPRNGLDRGKEESNSPNIGKVEIENKRKSINTAAVEFAGKEYQNDKLVNRTVNMKQPSTINSVLSKLKGKKFSQIKPMKAPTTVAAKTLEFPSGQFNHSQNRTRVQVFPFTPTEEKPKYENPTQYRVSLEGKKVTEAKNSLSSTPSSVQRINNKGQTRGLHGWNLPPHLVRRKMDTLEQYRDSALSFTKYSPRDKRDSITDLIDKYKKLKIIKTPADERISPTVTFKSGKQEHIETKIKHLEKMKSNGETIVTRRPQQKATYSRKDYEMNLWLNHVRCQEQQMMLWKQAEEKIRTPSTLHYCRVSSKGSDEGGHFGYQPQNTPEGYYDSQGQPISRGNLQQCSTVPKCVVEVEGTPLGWITGKGCGEWKPLPSGQMNKMLDDSSKNLAKKGKEDSLVQLLYDEVEEGLHEKVNENGDEESSVEPSNENRNEVEENMKDSKVDVSKIAKNKPLQGIASTVKVVMAATKLAKKRKKEDANVDSVLMNELDDNAIRKASEFKGGVIRQLTNLTDAIQMEYHRFIADVDYTNYYAARQIEAIQTGGCPPKTVLLISSTVPKCEQLKAAVLPGVLVHIYNYHSDNLEDLLEAISRLLSNSKKGVKAKYIGIVCKGGPGYFYLVKKMPVTTARIRSNADLLEFWQSMGNHISKLVPDQSVIHLMESNVAGNKKGEQLLGDLTSALLAHRIRVESPLELAPSGRKMLELYFNLQAHREWKEQRYKT